jgi:hypothetical protein
MNLVSNTSEFTADVLRVVNKIMEGSVRCQEELTMMGENVLDVVFNVWQEGSESREFVSPFSALYCHSHRSLLYSTLLYYTRYCYERSVNLTDIDIV